MSTVFMEFWGLGVFIVLALVFQLYFRRLDPKIQQVWFPRMSLFVMILISPIFVLTAIHLLIQSFTWVSLLIAIFLLGFLALIVNATVFQTRICEGCSKLVQPPYFFKAAAYCPRCGLGLSPAKLYGRVS